MAAECSAGGEHSSAPWPAGAGGTGGTGAGIMPSGSCAPFEGAAEEAGGWAAVCLPAVELGDGAAQAVVTATTATTAATPARQARDSSVGVVLLPKRDGPPDAATIRH